MNRGPVSAFYEFVPCQLARAEDRDFQAVAEILRCEESLKPRMTAADNPAFAHISRYYAVYPFKPRDQNDYLMLDRLLSQVNEPVRIEFRIEPAEMTEVRSTLIRYIGLVMSINQGREDLFLEGVRERVTGSLSAELHGGISLPERVKRDPVADEFLRSLHELQQKLREPICTLNVRVFGANRETVTLLASIVAECALTDGQYQVLDHDPRSPWCRSLIEAMRNNQPFFDSYATHWFSGDDAPKGSTLVLRRLARMAPVEELKGLWHLPVGGTGSPCCMYKSSDPGARCYAKSLGRDRSGGQTETGQARRSILVGYDLEMGLEPLTPDRPCPLEEVFEGTGVRSPLAQTDLELFKKHWFVSGVPGSGKTTAVFNLLVQLSRHGIPFLVIEPAKTEYRVLKALYDKHPDPIVKRLARRMQVFTPGNEALSPLRFNPLAYPNWVSRDEHIDALINCFKAGMEMFGPMEAVISEALENVYRSIFRLSLSDDGQPLSGDPRCRREQGI